MQQISARKRSKSGQALLEFALILPLLFLLIINVVNFGGMLFAWISVSNGARVGVQYYITSGATVGAPTAPSILAVKTLVQNDLHPLPNSGTSGLKVCVYPNTSGAWDCTTGATTPSVPAADTAENGITYPVAAVDVKYTFQPYISLWDFSRLGVHLTLPPTTIHKQAVMRIMQ